MDKQATSSETVDSLVARLQNLQEYWSSEQFRANLTGVTFRDRGIGSRAKDIPTQYAMNLILLGVNHDQGYVKETAQKRLRGKRISEERQKTYTTLRSMPTEQLFRHYANKAGFKLDLSNDKKLKDIRSSVTPPYSAGKGLALSP